MENKISFVIDGMTCAVCAGVCEKALKALNGVSDVSVNLATKKAQVTYDNEVTDITKIYDAIKKEGYTPIEPKQNDEYRKLKQLRILKIKVLVSLIFAFAVMYIAMAPMINLPPLIDSHTNPVLFTLAQLVLTLIVMAAGYRFYTEGFKNIYRLKPNMDSLVALGTSAAFIYSLVQSYRLIFMDDMHAAHNLFYESAAVIVALILLGKFLEMRSVGKTGEAIKKLLDLSPKTTLVLREGIEQIIPVSEVIKGDILIAKPGDSIAVDGIIVKGVSYIDESMLTGESVSEQKTEGAKVFAGTVNKSGLLHYLAQSVGEDTVLSKIIKIVEEAQGSKAPIAKAVDKVSAVFVPIVAIVAVVAFALWLIFTNDLTFSLTILVSVFVIACPCALGLATPAAIITGTGRAAGLGILFKSAESIQNLSKTKEMIFDKTGTLTEGKPAVTDIHAEEGFTLYDVLSYCASVEQGSRHPIAEAITNEAKEREVKVYEITDFSSEAGRGVRATVNGKSIKAGNIAFFSDDIKIKQAAQKYIEEGKTVVIVGIDDKFAGIISARDKLKSDTAEVIGIIKKAGVKTTMLTGDNRKAAEAVAKICGINEVIAEVLPNEKADAVKSRKHTAMVGDGINDAPALASADCGIAIGGGTDIAVESADVVLTGKSLKGAAEALILSKKVMRNVKQNLFWAFIYNVIGIPIAAGLLYPLYGILLDPMIAAFAMSFSSVSVVTNALRLNMYKSKFNTNSN